MCCVSRYSSILLLTGIIIPAVMMACSPQRGDTVITTVIQATEHNNNRPIFMPPTFDELANMAYAGIYDDVVTLKNGRWTGEPYVSGGKSRPQVGIVDDFMLTGDLDGDGLNEAAAILTERTGGSGIRSYVVAVGRRDNGIVDLGTALIGDRVQVRHGRITGGKIILEVIQQGAGDAACCPSQKARRFWTLDANGLKEGEAQMTGTFSLADIAGKTWLLTQLKQDKPHPAQPVITLTIDDKHAAGKNACNRYFANVTSSAIPGDLTLQQISSTRMTCPDRIMDLESNYLEALKNVSRYRFLAGKLALTWQKNDTVNIMLFVSSETQEEF